MLNVKCYFYYTPASYKLQSEQEAHLLAGPGEKLRHSTLTLLQAVLCMSLVVILRQTVAEICASVSSSSVSSTFLRNILLPLIIQQLFSPAFKWFLAVLLFYLPEDRHYQQTVSCESSDCRRDIQVFSIIFCHEILVTSL